MGHKKLKAFETFQKLFMGRARIPNFFNICLGYVLSSHIRSVLLRSQFSSICISDSSTLVFDFDSGGALVTHIPRSAQHYVSKQKSLLL